MSDKITPFDPEKITFVEFKMVTGQVNTPEEFDLKKVKGHRLENSLQLGFNLTEQLVKADFTIEVKTESNGHNKEEALGNFRLVFIYHVEHLEQLAVPNQDNIVELHPNLGNALSSVTYSTVRGILLTRLQGTALQNFILPIINPNKLLVKID